ncbi:heme exporter protein CcmD [Marinicella rhabdoformis]|uniref:heme exporter protein CcmD n=1 Tax=Marinicella rhabdoformis TaxID=2580566 RepID=UPI0012AEBABB|nr:heme exporter protein CcmD [Marinicella rhabdoformis]
MSELFHMGGYEFYVWGSMACFFVIMAYDFLGLQLKKKQAERQVKAMHKKAKNRKAKQAINKPSSQQEHNS